jgi:hypothetical protein
VTPERRSQMFDLAAKLAGYRADAHGRDGARLSADAYLHVEPFDAILLEASNEAYDRSHREHAVWEAARRAGERQSWDW